MPLSRERFYTIKNELGILDIEQLKSMQFLCLCIY